MIKLNKLCLALDDQVVFDNVNFNFGRETYLLSGQMHKRKSLLIDEIAKAFISFHPNINYCAERGVVYLPNTAILIENLTVKQNLEFFAGFFKTPLIKTRVIANHFEFEHIISRKVNSLTADIKQLVRIACVCMNMRATVYIFDEIFDHLSKSQISLVKNYLKQLDNDIILIISKQNTHELEEFKPRVINIVDKKLVYEVV